MATLVFFHAHPDDESINTAGSMARATAEGHRVVLVFATAGEEGEVAEGFLAEGERLGDRRRAETEESARVIGVARTVFLGYHDSGMMGTPENDNPGCFWRADIAEAAARLASLLDDESADVLVAYDPNGGYGHPDHIQVHRVGHAAADRAGTPRVYEATTNRDRVREHVAAARATGEEIEEDDEFLDTLGVPDAEITTEVDVSAHLGQIKASMRAHASQIPDDSWFLSMSPDRFAAAFGTEWYIRTRPPFSGRIPEDREDWLL